MCLLYYLCLQLSSGLKKKMQCVLLSTVMWYMFSHEFNFSDEIIK